MIYPAFGRWTLVPLLVIGAVFASPGFGQSTERPLTPRTARPAPQQRPRPVRPPSTSITEPSDPAKVRGTYELAGKVVQVTEGEFYATYELLKPHRERRNVPLRPQQVLEHMLLFAEARALGFAPESDELDAINPLKQGGEAYAQQLRARWKQMGITEEGYLEYLRQTEAIDRMRTVLGNGVRVLSEDAYDLWKRDSQMFRIGYLEFSAAAFVPEVAKETPDQMTLKKFWNSNTQIQNTYRLPTTVSGSLLVFDPAKITEADIDAARAKRAKEISYEEALAYFQKNKERLIGQIPSEKRPQLHPKSPPKLASMVTPFSLLRDQIEREILLGDRIGAAFAQARAAKENWDPAALAKEHGLELVKVENMSRTDMTAKLSRFGYELFSNMFASEPKSVSAKIHHHDSLRFFWRVDDRKISTLPTFDEAMARGLEKEWRKAEAFNRARAKAEEVMSTLGKKAEGEIRAKSAEIDAKWDKRLADALGSATGAQADAIKTSHRARAQAEKNQLRHQSRAEYFDVVVEKLGHELKEHGPFVFNLANRDRSGLTTDEEKRLAYLETNYAVKTLQPGQVTSILSDVVTKTHFIVKLIGREDPPFEEMSAVDYHRRSTQLERQKAHANTYDWTYMRVSMRRKWQQF